jgi:hypothetical protein
MHITITSIVLGLGAIQATAASPIRVPPPQEVGSLHTSPLTPAQVSGPVLPLFPPVPVVGPIVDKNLDIPTACPSDTDAILDPTEVFPETPAASFNKLRTRKCADDDTWCLVGQAFCWVCSSSLPSRPYPFSASLTTSCLYRWVLISPNLTASGPQKSLMRHIPRCCIRQVCLR